MDVQKSCFGGVMFAVGSCSPASVFISQGLLSFGYICVRIPPVCTEFTFGLQYKHFTMHHRPKRVVSKVSGLTTNKHDTIRDAILTCARKPT